MQIFIPSPFVAMTKSKKLFLWILLVLSVAVDHTKSETCTDNKTGKSGDCVAIQQCPKILERYQKFKEPPTICNPRFRFICCPSETKEAITAPLNVKVSCSMRISARKCREYASRYEEKVKLPSISIDDSNAYVTVRECSHNPTPLVTGGEEAKEKEFPHMALIGYRAGNYEDYACGGSLISEQWILSAAHCSSTKYGPATLAKLGDVKRLADNQNSFTLRIVERISHPSYTRKFADNDIALFKLERPIKFNDYVVPICLPSTSEQTTRRAIVTGWGKTSYYDTVSNTLLKVTIDYFNRKTCNEVYGDSGKLANNAVDWDRMVCAGSTNKTGDTCQGDSGGPLQIFNLDSDVTCMYTIVGVTSFGNSYCGVPGVPAIYTKVHFYLDWIESIVWAGQ